MNAQTAPRRIFGAGVSLLQLSTSFNYEAPTIACLMTRALANKRKPARLPAQV